MTYTTKKYNLQNNRSQVLNTKVAIALDQVTGTDEDTFNNQYLWGDGINKGVEQIIQEYYTELNDERGDTFLYPTLANYTQAGWNVILKNAVDGANDNTTNGPKGFYTTTNPGTINLNTPFLNGDSRVAGSGVAGTAGIIAQINYVKSNLGGNTIINSLITQINTLKSLVDTTRTNLSLIAKGINTLFATPLMSVDVSVGDTTNITAYLSSINTYLGVITDLYPTQTTLYGYYNYAITHVGFDATQPVVTGVFTAPPSSSYTITLTATDAWGGTHVMTPVNVTSVSTAATVASDINTNFNAYVTASSVGTTLTVTGLCYGLLQYITVGGTAVTTYWAVSGGAGTKYGTNGPTIGPLFITLVNNISTLVNNRSIAVSSMLGYGLSYNTGINKWKTFWIEMRIGKPTASLINLAGDSKALATLPPQLTQAETYLGTIIGTTWAAHQQYVPTPKALACFQNPLFDKTTGEITQMRTGFVFDGQPHATFYFIYKQPAPVISQYNINADTQWVSMCCYDRYYSINSRTNFINTFYTDTKTNFTTGQKWIYRVRTGDTINKVAGDTTASAQSSLYDSSITQSFSISSDSVIHFGATNLFKKGNYVVINGTASSNGYYYVKDTGDTSIWVTPIIGNNAGTVYLCNSIVSV
jgi:hypothetical protein